MTDFFQHIHNLADCVGMISTLLKEMKEGKTDVDNTYSSLYYIDLKITAELNRNDADLTAKINDYINFLADLYNITILYLEYLKFLFIQNNIRINNHLLVPDIERINFSLIDPSEILYTNMSEIRTPLLMPWFVSTYYYKNVRKNMFFDFYDNLINNSFGNIAYNYDYEDDRFSNFNFYLSDDTIYRIAYNPFADYIFVKDKRYKFRIQFDSACRIDVFGRENPNYDEWIRIETFTFKGYFANIALYYNPNDDQHNFYVVEAKTAFLRTLVTNETSIYSQEDCIELYEMYVPQVVQNNHKTMKTIFDIFINNANEITSSFRMAYWESIKRNIQNGCRYFIKACESFQRILSESTRNLKQECFDRIRFNNPAMKIESDSEIEIEDEEPKKEEKLPEIKEEPKREENKDDFIILDVVGNENDSFNIPEVEINAPAKEVKQKRKRKGKEATTTISTKKNKIEPSLKIIDMKGKTRSKTGSYNNELFTGFKQIVDPEKGKVRDKKYKRNVIQNINKKLSKKAAPGVVKYHK